MSLAPARPFPEKFLVAFSLAGEQRPFVRAIAEAVEKEVGHGRVFYDEWFEAHLAGNDADLKLQNIYGVQCELAVYCVSKAYDEKPWTQVEHRMIRARSMKAAASKDLREKESVLPIRVGDGDVDGIPFNSIVPDVRNRTPEQCASLIVTRLLMIVPGLKTIGSSAPVLPDWPAVAPVLSWPMADHTAAREAFAALLSSRARWRFLPIRGASETGKTHISRQMFANGLTIPEIACGRFDFKGTANMDAELQSFVVELQVTVPPGGSLHGRFGQVLGALKARAHPTLLIFDTYEMAGEAQEWVEKQLLPSLIRNAWLRVVIIGQTVPDAVTAMCGTMAHPAIRLEQPQAADWFEFGRQYSDQLTLTEVESAYNLARKRVSLMAQLLGPCAH